MKRTLLRCGWVVSMDDTIGDMQNVDILIDGDQIVAVGTDLGPADDIIEARDMIAIPGLIDAHLHAWETGFKSVGCDWRGKEYFKYIYGGVAPWFGPEDNYIATMVGALSRLDGGVTTLLDYCHNLTTTEQASRSVDALDDSGIRAVFALGDGRYKPEQERADPLEFRVHARDRVRTIRDRLHDDDARVTMSLAFAGPHWAREEAIRTNLALARDFGLRTTSHATKKPSEELMPGGYATLAAEGLLGPEHTIVHGNYLGDDELARLIDSGVSVTSTVLTEFRAYGRPPLVDRVIRLGGIPSLGIDIEPKVPGDMFREMQMALAVVLNARAVETYEKPDSAPPPILTREALRWATIGGAKALGIDHRVGTLSPGKQADIVLLRASDINLFPVRNPLFSAVEFAHAGNVDTVLVAGKVVKAGGKLSAGEKRLADYRERLLESSQRILAESGLKF